MRPETNKAGHGLAHKRAGRPVPEISWSAGQLSSTPAAASRPQAPTSEVEGEAEGSDAEAADHAARRDQIHLHAVEVRGLIGGQLHPVVTRQRRLLRFAKARVLLGAVHLE